jgi:hypothetical protein
MLKGLSHEIFMVLLAGMIYLGLNRNRLWFFNFKGAPSILDSHFKFDAFHTKPSQRLLESPRRIDKGVCSALVNFI